MDKKKKKSSKEKVAKPKKSSSKKSLTQSSSKVSLPPDTNSGTTETKNDVAYDPTVAAYETQQIFSKYDLDCDGKLDRNEFALVMRNNPEFLRTVQEASKRQSPNTFPTDFVSHRLLTHFDETAGVAIPSTDVESHKLMGNSVVPLVESYRARYDKLRGLLTQKLLPKREYLLQIRRELQNCSTEVDAARRAIERETLADTEKILERLRNAESMRQSSIKHSVMQVEEELQIMERIVRRVEQANIDEKFNNTTGISLTSAVPGAIPVESFRPPRASSMVELIHQYADLCSHIERLSTKPLTVQVEFPTNDFPKEISERLEVIARCDRYTHALNVKDHILWNALQEKERAEELLVTERKLSHEYAQEVAHWAEMAQEFNNKLQVVNDEKHLLERRNQELINVLRDHNILYVSSNIN